MMQSLDVAALPALMVLISVWPVLTVVLAVALVVSGAGGIWSRRRAGEQLRDSRRELDDSRQDLDRQRDRLENDLSRRRDELETDLRARRDRLEAEYQQRSRAIEEADRLRRAELAAHQQEASRAAERAGSELARISGLTADRARQELLERAEASSRAEAEELASRIEAQARQDAENSARRVVVTAIQRCAGEITADSVVATVDLPSDDMKGRIIGREGRNIRTIEQVTGTTVIIDDTPGIVLISCFDPVRREVARLTLADLVGDGRIHPSRIEQAHDRAVSRIEQICLESADEALRALSITDMASGLRPILGSLRFRTSYGQDVLAHSVECGQLAGLMAADLGADVDTCRRAGLLHDIGKSLTPRVTGSHAAVGAELARRQGESQAVVHAIAAHHNELEPTTVVDFLIQAADAISASRPGARRTSLESHIERLEELEELASGHPGVARAFAVQAGRDLRVMVEPEEVDDAATRVLARQIASEVGERVAVPGQVKVTVIREIRAVAVTGQSDSVD